jgi:Zn-dependent protease
MENLNIGQLVIHFVIFIFSLTLHEFGHAWTSEKFGDSTGRYEGRITLNPLAHIDPIGTVVFPLIGFISGIPMFGWARPVPVDPRQWRNKVRADICVSLAGPAANLLILITAVALLKGLIYFVAYTRMGLGMFTEPTLQVIYSAIGINLGLMVFNLLPIPPLDGSHVMKHLLGYISPSLQETYVSLGAYGFIILIIAMNFGVLNYVYAPFISLLQRIL